jgi:hypothetical protein
VPAVDVDKEQDEREVAGNVARWLAELVASDVCWRDDVGTGDGRRCGCEACCVICDAVHEHAGASKVGGDIPLLVDKENECGLKYIRSCVVVSGQQGVMWGPCTHKGEQGGRIGQHCGERTGGGWSRRRAKTSQTLQSRDLIARPDRKLAHLLL